MYFFAFCLLGSCKVDWLVGIWMIYVACKTQNHVLKTELT
jgi:hypothetical protein